MEAILELLSPEIQNRIRLVSEWNREITEIRLRIGQPLQMVYGIGEQVIWDCVISEIELRRVLSIASRYSLYAHENQMKQGFLTIRGGHRIGVAGQMSGESQALQHISSLNIRVAHEKKGCAEPVKYWMVDGDRVLHSLIIAPPGGGKTTFLRDCIRLFSNGWTGWTGKRVAVADERFEVSACYQGIPQNDLGIRTDVLAGCKKNIALQWLLRSMNPQVLAVDEIGGPEEWHILESAARSGCGLLATLHGDSADKDCQREQISRLPRHRFERIIYLNEQVSGRICAIYDGKGDCLWEKVWQPVCG